MVHEKRDWHQAILANFGPKKEQVLLVIDPDNLLRDDALLASGLQEEQERESREEATPKWRPGLRRMLPTKGTDE
jgi:hypothetical protein